MKIIPVITADTHGADATTPSAAAGTFGMILSAAGDYVSGNAGEQIVQPMLGKQELKGSLVSQPPLNQVDLGSPRPKVEVLREVLVGKDDAPISSDIEAIVIDTEEAPVIEAELEQAGVEPPGVVAIPATLDEKPAGLVFSAEEDFGVEAPIEDMNFATVAPSTGRETMTQIVAEEMAFEVVAEPMLAEPDWAIEQPIAAPAVLDGGKAVIQPSNMEILPPRDGHRDLKLAQALAESVDVSGTVSHAVKTLHTLDMLDDAGAAPTAEEIVIEGEVIESSPLDMDRIDATERSGRPAVRILEDKPVSPVNLGKPVLSMLTQEMLQSAVTDRHDGVVVTGGVVQTAGFSPASQAAAHGQQTALHQVVVATTPQRLVPDVGVELVREIGVGKQEVSIRLDPAELGRIEIKMIFSEDGRMRAVIAADNQQTYDLLRRDADTLVKTLAEAGVKTGAGDLRFDMRQGKQSDERQAKADGDRGRGDQNGVESAANEKPKQTRSMRGRLV